MVDTVSIRGGTFLIVSGKGAGIGAGTTGLAGNSTVRNLAIQNGSCDITAERGAAGIGAGSVTVSPSNSSVGELRIEGGAFNISAIGGGAAIGSGSAVSQYTGTYLSTVTTLAIFGGSFDLQSANGAAIGAGSGTNIGSSSGAGGVSSVVSMAITGGEIRVHAAGNSAGLGTGFASSNGNSTVNTLSVTGAAVTVHGAATGIGAGPATNNRRSIVGQIAIGGGEFDLTGQAGSPGIGARSATVTESNFAFAEASVGSIVIAGGAFAINAEEPSGFEKCIWENRNH
jgi:hypothetical protein